MRLRPKTKNRKLVEKYLAELEHFFVPGAGGWPLFLEPHHEKLVKLVPALTIKGNRLVKKSKGKLPLKLMIELYKIKLEEIHDAMQESLSMSTE
jgi:hypothetical protein